MLDPKMIEQRNMIARVRVPSIGGGDRRARLAGVALVHRDHAEVGRKFLGRIEWAVGPEFDTRSHAAGREQQDRVTSAVLFKMYRHFAAFERWHFQSPCMKPLDLGCRSINLRRRTGAARFRQRASRVRRKDDLAFATDLWPPAARPDSGARRPPRRDRATSRATNSRPYESRHNENRAPQRTRGRLRPSCCRREDNRA